MNNGQVKRLEKRAALLTATAMAERARRYSPLASDYIDAILVLRSEKGRTWNECAEFFRDSGFRFSSGALQAAYFKWKRRTRKAKA